MKPSDRNLVKKRVKYKVPKGRDLYLSVPKMKKVGQGLYPVMQEKIPLGRVKWRPPKKRQKSE